MTIAYLDVIHNLRFTRPGSRKHEEFNVTAQVPVDIRDLSPLDVEHVGTLTYEGHPERRIHAWEGTLLTPVTDDKGTGVPVASLTDFRARNGLMLGKAFDWNGSALHGYPSIPRRPELPIGRVLSDAFPESKVKVELVGQRLVAIDGILHERTHPPAWVAYVTARNDEVIVHTVESAYPDEIPHIGGGHSIQMFCADDTASARAYADALADASGLPVRWCPTGLEVIDAAALRFDAAGLSAATSLRKAVSGVTRQGAPALQHLDDRALTTFMAVRRAASAAPGERPTLVEARDILAEYAEVLDAQPRIEGHPLAGFRIMLAEVSGEARAFVMRHDACETLSPEGEEDARFLSAL